MRTPDILFSPSQEEARLVDKIIEQLASGVPPWRKPWANSEYYVVIGGNKHSANSWPSNVRAPQVPFGVYNGLILLMAANVKKYKTNFWISRKAVKELGAEIKSGGEPCRICAYFEGTDTIVYNVEQVKDYDSVIGLSLNSEKGGRKIEYTKSSELFKALQTRTGLQVKHGENRAFYNRNKDFIGMPSQSQFEKRDAKNGEVFYWATLWHEIVHWTGAPFRLNREKGDAFGDDEYAFEELVAELGATFLCSYLKIEGNFQNASYIASWLRGTSQTAEDITKRRMRKFARYLSDSPYERLRKAAAHASEAKKFILRESKAQKRRGA